MMRPAIRTAVAVSALALAPAVFAQPADTFPQRRSGQWQLSIVTEKPSGTPPAVMQVCVDPATDRELMEFGLRIARGTCKKHTMRHAGNALVIDAECKLGPIRSVTKSTLSGDFRSKYTVRTEGTTESKVAIGNLSKGPRETLVVQTARWTSATCTGGLKPGDIAMPGGLKVNVQKIKGLQQMLPQILGR